MKFWIQAVIFIFGVLSILPTRALSANQPYLAVIDPGHGGDDLGAIHRIGDKTYFEKDLTLMLAKDVANALRSRGVRAVLTRGVDKDLELFERTAIANRLGANIFISIHMNSEGRKHKSAQGIETYILNNSTNQKSKRLADLENKVLEGSKVNQRQLSDVSLIIKDLMLDANLEKSLDLACAVQNKVVGSLKRYRQNTKIDRGVRQALFYVLLGADMPSILLEAGFIHNQSDRSAILVEEKRLEVSNAIADAIHEYRAISDQSGPKDLASCKVI